MSAQNIRYKYCIVPKCTNTTITTPNKLFICVPKGEQLRKEWCIAMKRDNKVNKVLSSTSNRFCCEDHFELETDLENYMKWKMMGGLVRLKKGVLPHIFKCQESIKPSKRSHGKILENIESSNLAHASKSAEWVDCGSGSGATELELSDQGPTLVPNNEHISHKEIQVTGKQFFQSKQVQTDNAANSSNVSYPIKKAVSHPIKEVKQEPDDPFLEEYKIDIEEHFIPSEITRESCNYEKDNNNQTSCYIKNELVSIKQENETNLQIENLQQTCIEFKTELQQVVDDEDIKCNLIRIGDIKQSKKGTFTEQDRMKHRFLSGDILSCRLCGKLFTKNMELSRHAVRHLVKKSSKSNGYRTKKDKTSEKGLVEIKRKLTDSKNRSFRCELCSKSFTVKRSLVDHARIHIKAFKCEICSKSFSGRNHINIHMRRHTGEKPFECEICSKLFVVKSALVRHARIHTGEKPFECEICPKSFTVKESLVKHSRMHISPNAFKCEICSKSFIHQSSLIVHMRHHTGEKPFECEICSKSFTSRSSLLEHVRIHTNPEAFKCKICSKSFIMRGTLNLHMRIHTGEKPFKCEICSKCFTQRVHLDRHKQVHAGIKPFKCEICSKFFTHKTSLADHTRLHTGEKPFKCETCSKSFTFKNQLANHAPIHSNPDAFKCEICSKFFKQPRYLSRHMRTHTRENPITCDICLKTFTEQRSLERHNMRIHTGEKPFACDFCFKSFTERGSLNGHMRSHTGEKPFQCEICSRSFTVKKSFLRHARLHTELDAFKCEICSKAFTERSALTVHMRIHNPGKSV